MTVLGEIREQLAAGEAVDCRRALALLAIDRALADQDYVEEAAARQRAADDAIDGHPQ